MKTQQGVTNVKYQETESLDNRREYINLMFLIIFSPGLGMPKPGGQITHYISGYIGNINRKYNNIFVSFRCKCNTENHSDGSF